MDYIEVKQWLESYMTLYHEIEEIDRKMQGVKAIIYTNEAPGGVKVSMEYYISKKEKYEKQMAEIKQAIHSIPNYAQRIALEHRYLEGMNVKDVAAIMHYDQKYMSIIIKRGVMSIVRMKNTKMMNKCVL